MSDLTQATRGDTALDVSLVVVTHNSRHALGPIVECLASGEAQAFRDVVFVDNASEDGTVEYVPSRVPQARVIANASNRGFAAGVNQAVRESSGAMILLANPDVRWNPGNISALVRFLDTHPRAAAVCPRLVHPDGRLQPSVRRFPTHANIWLSRQSPLRVLQWVLPSRFAYTQPDPDEPTRVEAIAASFMLMRRDAFDTAGGMNEEYFLYVEDTDLCKRWHDLGWEVWIDPTIAVTHDWQGGSGRNPRLRRYHRDGIRRYFRDHHADKPVRNFLLAALLSTLDLWDRLRHRATEDAHQ